MTEQTDIGSALYISPSSGPGPIAGRDCVGFCALRSKNLSKRAQVRGNNDAWQTGANSGNDEERGTERGLATKTRPKTKKPSQYRVLLLNDDYTPMEFVVSLLMGVFKKTQEEATRIMLDVHQNGIGICGIYTFEVAETKVAQVLDAAKRHDHPLKCTLEKA